MRDATLVRHFLRRFADHDYLPSSAGRREKLTMGAGTLAGFSVGLSLLVSIKYQFEPDMPPGITSLSFLDDCASFVSTSMFLLALVAVIEWDALALDSRDVAVLGVLPVSPRRLIRAKMIAVCSLALGVGLAWNVPGMLLRPVAVPSHLPVGAQGVLLLTVVHALVTLAAGAFGFLTVYAVREGVTAVLGRRGFRLVSTPLQALLLMTVSVGLLLIPATTRDVARDWFAPTSAVARWYPPAWFAASYERMAGDVVDRLPHETPRYRAAAEARATELYRSRKGSYQDASATATVALVIATLVCLVSFAWNSRRLPDPGGEAHAGRWPVWSAARLAASIGRVQSGIEHAGFYFTLQALSRCAPHRMTLATWLGGGLSVIVVSVGDQALVAHQDASNLPTALLAAQAALLGAVLIGFSQASTIAADARASLTVALAATGNQSAFVTGVRKAAGMAIVSPVVAVLLPWHVRAMGLHAALVHAVVGLATGALLVGTLLRSPRGVPVVGGFGEQTTPVHTAITVAGVLAFSWALAGIERLALGRLSSSAGLTGALAIAATVVLRRQHRSGPLALALDFDASPVQWTQRLDLNG